MNKMKISIGVILIVSAASLMALSGCSTYQYRRFEAPGAATVQLINVSSSPVYARESHRGDCSDSWPFDNNGAGILPNTSRSTPVLPGSFFVIVVNGKVNIGPVAGGPGSFSGSSCLISVGFTVESDALYEISYGDNGASCNIQSRWRKKDGAWQSLNLTKMKPKNIFVTPVTCEKAEK